MAMARNSAARFSPNYGARRAKMETMEEHDHTGVPAADDSMLPVIGGGAGNTDAVNTQNTNPGMQYTMTSFLKNPT